MNRERLNPAELVQSHLGWSPEGKGIRRIPTGKFNDTFTVTAPDREFVIRIAPSDKEVFCFYERNMMRQEPAIHEMLLEKTDIPAAEIQVADFSRKLVDRDFLIMEKLPGRPLTEAHTLDPGSMARALVQTGRYLRQAHEIKNERFGYIGAHRPMQPADNWHDAFRDMWEKLIADIENIKLYTPEEAAFMRNLRSKYDSAFQHNPPACFLHMDIWHQNILVDNSGNVTGIVDWDRALWGDPEIEFAVLDYTGMSGEDFWTGYAKTRPAGEDAEIRRLFYLLYELQKYIVIRKGRNHRPREAESYKQQSLELARRL